MLNFLRILKIILVYSKVGFYYINQLIYKDYVRGEAEGALAPLEFEGSEMRLEGETDNPLLIAPSESKS